MKAPVIACYCCVDRVPCDRYRADPERHCVCSVCGHTGACHRGEGGETTKAALAIEARPQAARLVPRARRR